MKKSSIRSFGIACFLIGALYVTIDKFNLTRDSSLDNHSIVNYEEQITELEKQLADANKQIEELNSLQQKQDDKVLEGSTTDEQTNEVSTEMEPTAIQNNQDDVVQATLYIYSGLTAYDIGKKLEDLGIVENGLEMELYLAKPEYAKSIQIGQFDLNSSMTIEEIANIITGKAA